MYRIYDKQEAIKRVQQYLIVVGNPSIFVVPTGVFDDNTKRAVIDFQSSEGLGENGVVDKKTFDLLFERYIEAGVINDLKDKIGSSVRFPIMPADVSEEMIRINKLIENILNYHGITHRIIPGRFYSSETGEGVKNLRRIFLMDDEEGIDEKLYIRMVEENDSIDLLNRNNLI